MVAYTLNNTALSLKEPPLNSGGEGAVYEIIGYPGKVAKIYHDTTDALKREAKIREMVTISGSYSFKNANISQDIAWPLSPLFDKNRNFIGFGMNRISASMELDDLYVYPPKNNTNVTIKDRVTCLINLCDVIDRLHQIGQVFGDFNPNNIKIKPDWSVSFVDADSYHVKSSGKEFRCSVCAPGYVAPELIRACSGTTYADCPGTTFTKETDNFALGIHLFRMLMNGCHPFICERHLKRAGSAPAPKSTDKRVESGETPFFKIIPNYVAPQYAPDINTLPPYIRNLFRKAFVDGHTNPCARPDASEWKNALIRFRSELTDCRANSMHYFWKGNCSCPYCDADQRYNRKMGLTTVYPKKADPDVRNSNGSSSRSYQLRHAASIITPAISTCSKPASSGWFWFTTVVIAIITQILLGMYVLPVVYAEVFGNETLTTIGVIGSMIAGIVGSVLYNCKWTPGRYTGMHSWWEYLLSELIALGFTIGFGIAMGLLILVFYIIVYLFVGTLIIAIIIGAFSGG